MNIDKDLRLFTKRGGENVEGVNAKEIRVKKRNKKKSRRRRRTRRRVIIR